MFQDNTHPSLPLLKHGPAIWRPTDGTLDEDGGSILGDTVTVADENVLTDDKVDLDKLAPLVFDSSALAYRVIGGIAGGAWNAGKRFE